MNNALPPFMMNAPATGINGFTPASIGSMLVWYDPSQSTKVWTGSNATGSYPGQGGAVKSVSDLSGNTRTLNHDGTDAHRPLVQESVTLLTRPVLAYDGVDDFLASAAILASAWTASATIFAVFKAPAYSSGTNSICGSRTGATPANNSACLQRTAAGTYQCVTKQGTTALISSGSGFVDTDPHILIGVITSGVGVTLYVDNVAQTPALHASTTAVPAVDTTAFSIGSRATSYADGFGGWVGECGVIKAAASVAQVGNLWAYLYARWILPPFGPANLRFGDRVHYVMSEPSGSRADSGPKGLTSLAEVGGSVTGSTVAGFVSASLETSGGYLSVTDAALNPSGSFTISGWFYVAGPVENDNAIVVFKPAGTELFMIYAAGNRALQVLYNPTDSPFMGTQEYTPDAWNYFAVTYDAALNTGNMYLNDTAPDAVAPSVATTLADADLIIGSAPYIGQPVNLRGIRIRERVLSTTEIAYEYGQGP